jgi:gamma-glutamyltranspeptidase/glutathione hydrolase
MVCAPDHLAAGAGIAALRSGGTAADAAVAAAAVLAVTAEHMCGLGGDLFALVHRAGEERPAALNASGRAGSGADAARLRAEGHSRVPAVGDVRAVPVPGCVDGWIALHARFGRLALAELLEPARGLAEDGFPLSPRVAEVVPAIADLPWARDYASAGPPRAGALVRRPGVARTLAAIAAGGREAFYGGEFGAGLLELGAGEYSPEDLAATHADWTDPIGCDAWGRRLWTAPPNSQGYAALAGAWIAAGLDLPATQDGEWARLLAETAHAAVRDRDGVLHEGADGDALLAPERLEPRRAAVAGGRAAIGAAAGSGGDTVTLVAVDAEGLAVSLIQSHFAPWGAQLAVPGVDVVLHNRGASFSLAAEHPAEYGPGRRPPHTLSPMAITRDGGALEAVLGTRGGRSQPTILLQLLARHLAGGQEPGEALAAPRFILTDEGAVAIEETAPPGWRGALEAAGHRVVEHPAWGGEFGEAHLIAAGEAGLAGAADPRTLAGAAVGI